MEIIGLLRKSRELAEIIRNSKIVQSRGLPRKIRELEINRDHILNLLTEKDYDRAIVEVQGLRTQIQSFNSELDRYIRFHSECNGFLEWLKLVLIPVLRAWESESLPGRLILPDVIENLEEKLGIPKEERDNG
jgi:hypothetical protein